MRKPYLWDGGPAPSRAGRHLAVFEEATGRTSFGGNRPRDRGRTLSGGMRCGTRAKKRHASYSPSIVVSSVSLVVNDTKQWRLNGSTTTSANIGWRLPSDRPRPGAVLPDERALNRGRRRPRLQWRCRAGLAQCSSIVPHGSEALMLQQFAWTAVLPFAGATRAWWRAELP